MSFIYIEDHRHHLGMGAAITALVSVAHDADWWMELIQWWSVRDIDDDHREAVAQALADARSNAVKRAYDKASPEEKAAIDKSWEAMPGDIFGGATLDADWSSEDLTKPAEESG